MSHEMQSEDSTNARGPDEALVYEQAKTYQAVPSTVTTTAASAERLLRTTKTTGELRIRYAPREGARVSDETDA